MNIHTPYLENILLTCFLIFPMGLSNIIPRPKKDDLSSRITGLVVLYFLLVIITAVVLKGDFLFVHSAPLYMYFIAPLAGILCMGIEYVVDALQIFIRYRKAPRKMFAVHSIYSTKVYPKDLIFVFMLVVLEEMVMRQALFVIFSDGYGLPVWLTIGLTAIIYGLNHIYFGPRVVLQKTATGIIYALLYFASGRSLYIPIIAHLTQNVTLLSMARERGEGQYEALRA